MNGQLGTGDTNDRLSPVAVGGLPAMRAIAAGACHSAAVAADGTAWAWGGNGSGQLGTGDTDSRLTPVRSAQSLTGLVEVTAGYGHTLLLAGDGAIWGFGGNGHGALGDGTSTGTSLPVRCNLAIQLPGTCNPATILLIDGGQ
ncbi:MAG: RCC1 domain-containing protein [Solidesulfovibrio sp. DCME]|uniref:RCC1 domain-containing protein n=1 Tax=Solidesulfovibrio sp. DCME TaxID=3447380 RepID=UPI003D11C3EB